MALPIRPNNGAQPASKPTAVRRPSPKAQPAEDFSLPFLDDLMDPTPPARKFPVKKPASAVRQPEPEVQKTPELEEGWAIDEKTGVKYKTIPKSVYKGKGKNAIPLLAIEDFDADNMTGEAETYLSHLRIPPDKEEQERLKQLRIQLRRQSDASYAKANKDELEKSSEAVEEITEEQPKKSFIQKLTSLFR
jgi:hypothetical protein